MNAPAATKHQVFSFARLSAIASNTLLELVRLKVFYFLLLFALVGIGSSLITVNFTFQEQFQVMKDVALGAMSIFTWLLGVLATAMLLPNDIEDRTLYTILAKPVPRFEYLLGKLLGVLLLLFIALALMVVTFVAVLYAREQTVIAETMSSMRPGPEMDAALQQIRASTFNANLLPGITIIYFKAALCATLTLLLSTFATSSIFTIIVSVVVYIIGHVQPLVRESWMAEHSASPVMKVLFAFVSLIIPDLAAFNIDDIAKGHDLTYALFAQTAGLGGLYITVYFLIAYFIFVGKEL